MRYHLTLARMAIITKVITVSAREGMEKREPSFTVSGDVNWCNSYGEYEVSFKN